MTDRPDLPPAREFGHREPVEPGSSGQAVARSDRELACSCVVQAAREQVFDAFRDPEKLASWWGPDGFTNTFDHFDFRPGGAWKLTMHGPEGKSFQNELVIVEVEAPRRLVIDHVSKPKYVAEFRLIPVPGGTEVIYFQAFESAEVCRAVARFACEANGQMLERLAGLLQATR